MKNIITNILVTFTVLAAATAAFAGSKQVSLVSVEALEQKLGDENVIILDARSGRDWNSSEFKIKGAVRIDPRVVDDWADMYPKDKTIIVYCA